MKVHVLFSLALCGVLNIAYAQDPEDGETIAVPVILATPDHADLLRALQRNEVLPLVLIQPAFLNTLKAPEVMELLATKDGRMMRGTEFYEKQRDKQFFFCPSKKADQRCLVPQKFKWSEPLQCNDAPDFTIRKWDWKCGQNKQGELYKVVFDICPATKKHKFTTKEFKIYNFCYDLNNDKTLYTDHTILSPLILDQNLMKREREVKYDLLTSDHGSENLNYSLYRNELLRGNRGMSFNTKEFPYVVQELVPSDDMAFSTWRRPTAHFVNSELQHKDLTKLWDEINELIRIDATQLHFNVPYRILTGVFDIPENAPKADGIQLPNIWVKVITADYSMRHLGVAIIMDNFIYSDETKDKTPIDKGKTSINEDYTPINEGVTPINKYKILINEGKTPINEEKTPINKGKTPINEEKTLINKGKTPINEGKTPINENKPIKGRFCDIDYCEESIRQKFIEVGGRVNCCLLNDDIWKLFNLEPVKVEGLLRIANLIPS